MYHPLKRSLPSPSSSSSSSSVPSSLFRNLAFFEEYFQTILRFGFRTIQPVLVLVGELIVAFICYVWLMDLRIAAKHSIFSISYISTTLFGAFIVCNIVLNHLAAYWRSPGYAKDLLRYHSDISSSPSSSSSLLNHSSSITNTTTTTTTTTTTAATNINTNTLINNNSNKNNLNHNKGYNGNSSNSILLNIFYHIRGWSFLSIIMDILEGKTSSNNNNNNSNNTINININNDIENANRKITTTTNGNINNIHNNNNIANYNSENDPYSWKHCTTCNCVKPPRTHHCSVCNECVLYMDHHCPWVGNCVGLATHRHFILFMFWVVFGCSYYLCFALPYSGLQWFDNTKYSLRNHPEMKTAQSQILTSAIFAFAVACAVSGLLFFHIFLILTGQSTIEFLMFGKNRWLSKKHGKAWKVPFDKGPKKNWQFAFQSFGRFWWFTWILPRWISLNDLFPPMLSAIQR